MDPEDIFNAATLEVIVPEDVHEIPDEPDEDWLQSVSTRNQRDKAFFDERLLLFFTVKAPHPSQEPADPKAPPLELAAFLSRLQITLDSKYISSQPNVRQATHPSGINLTLPPRSHSYQKAASGATAAHPSIFPPHTPNPTPQTGESDRKYAGAVANTEGTVLESFVWGETAREEPEGKNFALVWSGPQNSWVAVYRITLGIAFLRTSVPEPVLSLTVSATLREKPLAITPDRRTLAAVLDVAGFAINSGIQPSAAPIDGQSASDNDELHGLQEVNILDGLSNGPSFGGKGGKPLAFPSTRFAASFRRTAFSLSAPQSTSTTLVTPSATTVNRATTSILRKSFLKTLKTVSGFQIRMKSVFVPYVAIPGTFEDEEERREAGSEERTIVLSVELANGSPATGPESTGFAVENIDVSVGGEGAMANLLTWGESGLQRSDSVFPLLVGPAEQFNLLYAITFLRQAESDEVADALRQEANGERMGHLPRGDLQRPVAIIVHGKPFDFWSVRHKLLDNPEGLIYPTQTFQSRWNCVLDLSTAGQSDNFEISSEPLTSQDALPAPATPFPAKTPTTAKYPAASSQGPTMSSTKRHTVGGTADHLERLVTTNQHRNSTSVLNSPRNVESPTSIMGFKSPTGGNGRPAPKLPSFVKGHARFGSTTAITNIPSAQPSPRTPDFDAFPPQTPAYPAYPTDAVPQTPASQGPLSSFRNTGSGYMIEPRRERAANAGAPQTPGPRMVGASFADEFPYHDEDDPTDQPVVVSVGLMPPEKPTISDLIFAFDTFAIEIFVFNRSERTRRFEVSYPDKKRRRQQDRSSIRYSGSDTGGDIEWRQAPGIVPLENRVRVGQVLNPIFDVIFLIEMTIVLRPLRPHTCQSVRMQFLALRPGIHPIASLTLTDVESGFSKNLK
ncbi:hypothetical protein BU17DRAFT_86296 [Hysterangium stoloniferum]|nr:hypothetical protein BU17DRAFT_86296 [Hysterangium stoloniferum]